MVAGGWWITLLDGFGLRDGGAPIDLSPAAQRLVALLALQDRPLPRAAVAARLWSNGGADRQRANLRAAMWRLPRPCRGLVVRRGEALAIDPEARTDLGALDRRMERLLAGTATADDLQVKPLLASLLPAWYDDWVLVERERFGQRRVQALERLSALLARGRRYGEAVEAAMAAVAAEPLREATRRQVIAVHLAEGNAAEALRHYELYAEVLRDQLGIAPSAGLRALIRSGTDVTAR